MEDGMITSAHKLAAWSDYNNGGFLDLAVKDGIGPNLVTGDAYKGLHYLFKNNGNGNHYIKLNLHGLQSNLNGIGARVIATYEGKIAFRENNGGGGGEWGSQGAGPIHFGIGVASAATVVVNWPSGVVDTISGVAANSTITLVEGSTNPTPTPTPTPSPPTITQQPRNATVTVGQTATFKVRATGTAPLSYQSRKNGANIAGATSPAYVTPPTTLADNGSSFSVAVSNSAGTVTSRKARLTVTSSTAGIEKSALPPIVRTVQRESVLSSPLTL